MSPDNTKCLLIVGPCTIGDQSVDGQLIFFRKLVAGPRREHLPDKLLYRDEAWFEALEREKGRREEGEEEVKQSPSETMTAPPEEQGDAGPLVPCKVDQPENVTLSAFQSTLTFLIFSSNLNFSQLFNQP